MAEAEKLVAGFGNARVVLGDVQDLAKISGLVEEADVVIRWDKLLPICVLLFTPCCSLLPVPFHPAVAKLCMQHKKHLVTASYISPEMKALHEE